MNTMTCSMPLAAGSGNMSPLSCARVGAMMDRSLHPSVMPPTVVAAVVRNLRRETSDIETFWPRQVVAGCGWSAQPHRMRAASASLGNRW